MNPSEEKAKAPEKTKALCVATRCTTIEQFVATFHRFCDESSFFVATLATRPVGLETAFSIQLEDKTPVLRGLCVVVEAWATPANRFGRPGVRLNVRRLTNESLVVFKQLQAARIAAEAAEKGDAKPVEVAKVESKPVVAKPVEVQPVEAKSVDADTFESKTADAKILDARQQLDSKPAETKPIDAKPIDAKAVETKPIEQKPADKLFPPIPSDKPKSLAEKLAEIKATPKPPAIPPRKTDGIPPIPAAPPIPPTLPKINPTAFAVKPAPARAANPTPSIIVEVELDEPTKIEAKTVRAEGTAPVTRPDIEVKPVEVKIEEGTTQGPAPAPPPIEAPTRPTPVPRSTNVTTPAIGISTSTVNLSNAALTAEDTQAQAASYPDTASIVDSPPAELTATPEPISAADDMTSPIASESRAPGSSFILPANPLMNLSDKSLEGFVDCALYEETGNFSRAPGYEDSLVDIDDVAAPPGVLAPTPAIRPGDEVSQAAYVIMPTQAYGGEHRQDMTPIPVMGRNQTQPPYGQPYPTGQMMPMQYPTGQMPPMQYPTAQGMQSHVPQDSTAALLAMSAPSRRRWMIIGAAAVFVSLVLLVIVIATRGGDKTATAATTPAPSDTVDKKQPGEKVTMAVTPTTQTPTTQTPETQTPVVPTKVSVVVPDDEEHAPPRDPNSPPVMGVGPCKLTVTTTPAGSIVRLDDQVMGPSPITIQGSCARKRVDVKHPRYAPGQRWVTLAEDKPAIVDIPLNRPTHAVTIVTQPAGATISIAGKRAGTSPTAVQMMGFTRVALTIEKKGYKTVVESIYSKFDGERRTVTLTRIK